MPRKLIEPDSLHESPGFSHIALATGTRLAFVAGQTAIDKDWTVDQGMPDIVGGDDLYLQSKKTMENVGTCLEEIGASWDDVVSRTIYTLQPTNWDPITRAIEEVTESTDHPAQVVCGVSGLALEGLLVEIECTVSLP